MGRGERRRLETSLLVIAGLYHTAEQWTRVLVPFFQWKLVAHIEFYTMLLLSSFGAFITAIGSFVVAQMIESIGLKKTAVVCTVATAVYQIFVPHVDNLYSYLAFHILLLFNHMPMVIDACVCQIEGQDGDDKKRTLMLGRLTIPQSISFALGPYMALQALFIISSQVMYSQMACGILHLITVMPIVLASMPKSENAKSLKMLPSFGAYWEIVKNERMRLCLGLLLMVVGPYNAYDVVLRAQLAATIIPNPNSIIQVFMVLGGTTLIANLFVIPKIQNRFTPQRILLACFAILTLSYSFLSFIEDYYLLLGGMCIQVATIAVTVGELSSQILSTSGKADSGKVAAMLRLVHLIGFALTPLLSGPHLEKDELSFLCYVGAAISALAVPLVKVAGHNMKIPGAAYLPMSGIEVGKFD